MNQAASDEIYELYKIAKNMIGRAEACSGNHSDEPMFEDWKKAIKTFDSLGRGYAERYEKEKSEAVAKT